LAQAAGAQRKDAKGERMRLAAQPEQVAKCKSARGWRVGAEVVRSGHVWAAGTLRVVVTVVRTSGPNSVTV